MISELLVLMFPYVPGYNYNYKGELVYWIYSIEESINISNNTDQLNLLQNSLNIFI